MKFSSITTKQVTKTVNMSEEINKVPDIIKHKFIQPFIYNLSYNKAQEMLLVTLETGNVFGYKYGDIDKRSFCIEGHTTRVPRSEFYETNPELLLTVSDDLSWALWDTDSTNCYKKVQLKNKANWIDSMSDGSILVSDVEGVLNRFYIKS